MKGYGQFCPVAKAAEVLAERWTFLVVRELLSGSRRFNDIRRGVPLMSPTLLSKRLKELRGAGIVERQEAADGGFGAEYHLTPAGEELRQVVELLGTWGHRWARSAYSRDELDAGLLMWEIRRRINLKRLPPQRIVVRFDFKGAPGGKRRWWLVLDRGEPDLSLTDPGYDVDLFVATDVGTLAKVWMGDLRLEEAVRSKALQLEGPTMWRKEFPTWLELSTFASVKPAVS